MKVWGHRQQTNVSRSVCLCPSCCHYQFILHGDESIPGSCVKKLLESPNQVEGQELNLWPSVTNTDATSFSIQHHIHITITTKLTIGNALYKSCVEWQLITFLNTTWWPYTMSFRQLLLKYYLNGFSVVSNAPLTRLTLYNTYTSQHKVMA